MKRNGNRDKLWTGSYRVRSKDVSDIHGEMYIKTQQNLSETKTSYEINGQDASVE